MIPEWIQSQREARGLCACCGEVPAVTEYAGTGEHLCWTCLEIKRTAVAW